MSVGTVSYLNRYPSWVVWNSTLLGFSGEGDVTVSFSNTWERQKSNQTGDLTLEAYWRPGPISVKTTLAEVANWSNLAVIFPFGQKQIDDSTPPANRFTGNTLTAFSLQLSGQKATSIAKALQIIPESEYINPSTETTNQFRINLAYPAAVGDFMYGLSADLAPEITFESLYDPAQVDGTNHWMWGKDTGTWVAA